MRGICALLGLLILMVPASATPPAEQPYRIADYGRLVTNVTINGQGPFSFLIDTASSTSLMFEHVRKKLNLGQSQPDNLLVYGINDVSEAMPVRPYSLSIAGEEIKDLTIGVLPGSGADEPDGVLGLDVLARYFVVLDRDITAPSTTPQQLLHTHVLRTIVNGETVYQAPRPGGP